MTVNGAISILRNLIKEYSAESHYTDEFLWSLYSMTKSKLLKNRLDKFKTLSPINYKTFCLALSEGLSHDCGCITVGCKVLTSCVKIPNFLTSRNSHTFSVKLFDGTTLNEIEESDFEILQSNELKKNKPAYSIVNGKLILWNTPKIKAVLVTAIWEDYLEWDNRQYCDNNCDEDSNIDTQATNTCLDLDTEIVDVDADMHYDIIRMVLQYFNIPLSIVPDRTNDSQEEIKL